VTDQVDAARAGDNSSLDALVAEYLPLVYNIVRRTLSSDADVDDVVQDTMVRVVRGIGGLREPDRFRPWLVAITVNQIRDHHRRRHTTATRLEEYDEQPDPGAEFVDRALTRLALSQQRREIEPAARWLGCEDRELLSLWSLERGGHLTRAEIASALEVDAHNVAVRLNRLKTRLNAARILVRAWSASPRCPELVRAASDWTGEPTPLWRKRFLRHVRACGRCRGVAADLVPVEQLLLGVALLAVPAGYAVRLLSGVHDATRSEVTVPFSRSANGPAHHAKPPRLPRRVADFVAAKPAFAVAAVTAVCIAVATPVVVTNLATGDTTAPLVNAQTTSTAPPTPSPSATPTTTPPPPPSTTAVPTTQAEPSSPQRTPSTAQAPAAESATSRLITLLNERRRGLGLPEVEESPQLVKAADDCVRRNLEAGTFEHCGHEVLFKGGKGTTPEAMIDAWFKSEGHRTALTYASSRNAGGAIVVDSGGTLIAAINIDY